VFVSVRENRRKRGTERKKDREIHRESECMCV